jgi:hypothetical protein
MLDELVELDELLFDELLDELLDELHRLTLPGLHGHVHTNWTSPLNRPEPVGGPYVPSPQRSCQPGACGL